MSGTHSLWLDASPNCVVEVLLGLSMTTVDRRTVTQALVSGADFALRTVEVDPRELLKSLENPRYDEDQRLANDLRQAFTRVSLTGG